MDTRLQIANEAKIKDLTASANSLSKSKLIPSEFQNNAANCGMALQYAEQMQLPVLTVLQAIYVVRGKVGFSTEFFLGRLLASKRIVGTVRYDVSELSENLLAKDIYDIAVTASVIDRDTGDEHSETISMRQAMAEGWAKSNPKYRTMGVQMLKKRAVTWLIRNCYPDVLQGAQERGELDDLRQVAEARTVEVVDRGMDEVNMAPGDRMPPQEITVEEPDEQPEDNDKGEPMTDEQEASLAEWMSSDEVGLEEATSFISESFGHRDPGKMSFDQAAEFLAMCEGGDFQPTD